MFSLWIIILFYRFQHHRIPLNFFEFLATKWYNTGGNGYRCLSGTNPISLASADWLDFAFCDFKLLLRMQSLDSVNVISQARISPRREVAGLFDKYARIKWFVEVDYRWKTSLKTIGKGGELLEILLFISLNNAALLIFHYELNNSWNWLNGTWDSPGYIK